MSASRGPAAPGAWEWLAGLSATVLLGYQSTLLQSAMRAQTGFRYYVEDHHTVWMHQGAQAINASILLLALCGFFARSWLPTLRRLMYAAMGAGAALVWWELVNLSRLPPTATYAFDQLPYIPVNNLGVLGSQVFLTMLLAAVRLRGVPALQAFGIKAALVLGLFFAQLALWETFLA